MRMLCRHRRGQVIIMVTFALVSMMGMVGLTVDLGWMHFVKKRAQAAADAAALAAASRAYEVVGQNLPVSCGDNEACDEDSCTVSCMPTISDCPASVESPSSGFEEACYYAEKNDFTMGGKSGRQAVRVQADSGSSPPTVPGRTASYWVTVRVSESVPQLFSAVLGNFFGTSASRATAMVVDVPLSASFYGINRENDEGMRIQGDPGIGSDIRMQGGGYFRAEGGAYLASTAHGAPNYSGASGGSAEVISDFVNVRGSGTVDDPGQFVNDGSATGTRESVFDNGYADGPNFEDPFDDKGEPPRPDLGTGFGKPNGLIQGLPPSQGVCTEWKTLPPGHYYSLGNNGRPDGGTLRFDGCVRFITSATDPNSNTYGFGDYTFFGGVEFLQGSYVQVAPGRYVLAGTSSDNVFTTNNKSVITDEQPINREPNNAGQLFVLTDLSYFSGTALPADIQEIANRLHFGAVDFKTGSNDGSLVNLHGLNAERLPAGMEALASWAPVLFWQDPQNSRCTNPFDYETACTANNYTWSDFTMTASPLAHLYGAIYQPRGSTFMVHSTGMLTGPIQLITGQLAVGEGAPQIQFSRLEHPLRMRIVALVE